MGRDYSEKNARPVQGGPTIISNVTSRSTNQWFGSTRITSAAGNVWFIDAPAVQTNGFISFYLSAATVPGSSTTPVPPLYVLSVSPGSGFYIGATYSVTAIVNTYNVNWKVDVRS